MIDESQSACIVDALVVICKRLSEPIEICTAPEEEEEVSETISLLESGEASRQDMEDVSSASVLWSAIIALIAKHPIYFGIEDILAQSGKFPTHIQRAIGALLCSSELIVQHHPPCSFEIAESLYRSLFGHSSPDKLLQLIEEYRQLIPFFYLFTRRAGQLPEPSTTLWKKSFHVDDYMVPAISAPGLNPVHPSGQRLTTDHETSEDRPKEFKERHSSDNMRNSYSDGGSSADESPSQSHSFFPTPSTWALEEDEDSDGQDYEPPPLLSAAIRKRTTRMKHHKSKKKTRNAKQRLGANSSRTSLFTSSGGLLDDDIEDLEVSSSPTKESVADVLDFNENSSHDGIDSDNDNELEHSADNLGSSHEESNVTEATHSDEELERSFPNPDVGSRGGHQLPLHISIAELQAAFDSCKISGRLDADKNRLCRELYSAGAPAIADKLRNLQTVSITWQQLLDTRNNVPVRNLQSQDHNLVNSADASSDIKANPQEPRRAPVASSSRISVASLLRSLEEEEEPLETGREPLRISPGGDEHISPVRESRDSVLVASRDERLPSAADLSDDRNKKKSAGTRISWGDERAFHSPDSEKETPQKAQSHVSLSHASTTDSNRLSLDMNSEDEGGSDEDESGTGESAHVSVQAQIGLPKSPSSFRVEIGRKQPSIQLASTPLSIPAILGPPVRSESPVISSSASFDRSRSEATATYTKPPLPIGASSHSIDVHRQAVSMSKSIHSSIDSQSSEEDDGSTLRIGIPPLSALGRASGVIVDGWLEKKSHYTGFWKKQYFILSESATEYCVLKVFANATESAWGTIPLCIKNVIPIASLSQIKTISKKSAKGREFKLYFHTDNSGCYLYHSKLPVALAGDTVAASGHSNIEEDSSDAGSDTHSAHSESTELGARKSMHLRAIDPQVRLLWTTLLRQAAQATHED